MADIKRATELVIDINKYAYFKAQLLEASVENEIVGICCRERQLIKPLLNLTFTDSETKAALNEFIASTLRYYDNTIAMLTEELSNL